MSKPPANHAKEFYDESKKQRPHTKPVSGLGDEAFSWYDSTEAGVQALYGVLQVSLSQVMFNAMDDMKDQDGAIAKLTPLAGSVLTQLK